MPLVILLGPDVLTLNPIKSNMPQHRRLLPLPNLPLPYSFTSQSCQLHPSSCWGQNLSNPWLLFSSIASLQVSSALLWKIQTLLIISSVNPWSKSPSTPGCPCLTVSLFSRQYSKLSCWNRLHCLQPLRALYFTQTSDKGLPGSLWYGP